MSTQRLEEAYNEMPHQTKEDVGFPDSYLFLTREQEQFIIRLFDTEREAAKYALRETLEEMKGLIDDL